MNLRQSILACVVASSALLLATLPQVSLAENARASQPAGAKQKMVLHVADADPKKWNQVFNNVKNVQQELGKDNVDVEIVANGPGINMLKLDSEVGNRVDEAIANGVKVVACENTMKANKLTRADMLPSTGYVPAGIVELMKKQQEGYAYIRN